MLVCKTVRNMDVASKRTWMYSQRVLHTSIRIAEG